MLAPTLPEHWMQLYQDMKRPPLPDTLTGFNMNLDRIIPVTRALFEGPAFLDNGLLSLRERLSASMRYCTAEEWFVKDTAQYRHFVERFSGSGSLAVGGQAGIAALHLSRLGISRVVCAVPAHGRQSAKLLEDQGIIVPEFTTPAYNPDEMIHLVFEYSPGLVPLAANVQPRNNRFIVSPEHKPVSVLFSEKEMESLLAASRSCKRAFLSGYQYLRSSEDYRIASGQLAQIRQQNPEMRVHIEWVSVTDAGVLDGCLRNILPGTDSLGLNENELLILAGHLGIGGIDPSGSMNAQHSPRWIIHAAIALCAYLRLRRVHVHTYGYYVVVRKDDGSDPVCSRTALLFAAKEAAAAALGSGQSLSKGGIEALLAAESLLGPAIQPGIFLSGAYTVILTPTLIVQDISRTTGLGDILSSTAFVADEF